MPYTRTLSVTTLVAGVMMSITACSSSNDPSGRYTLDTELSVDFTEVRCRMKGVIKDKEEAQAAAKQLLQGVSGSIEFTAGDTVNASIQLDDGRVRTLRGSWRHDHPQHLLLTDGDDESVAWRPLWVDGSNALNLVVPTKSSRAVLVFTQPHQQ